MRASEAVWSIGVNYNEETLRIYAGFAQTFYFYNSSLPSAYANFAELPVNFLLNYNYIHCLSGKNFTTDRLSLGIGHFPSSFLVKVVDSEVFTEHFQKTLPEGSRTPSKNVIDLGNNRVLLSALWRFTKFVVFGG